MNEDIMTKLGFHEAVKDVREGKCPSCRKVVSVDDEFRDEISSREYRISGLCQACQDRIFGA